MIRRSAAILLALLALPLLPPPSTVARHASASTAAHRIYYRYAPEQPEQRDRAAAAYRAAHDLADVEWVGICRGAPEATAAAPCAAASADDLLAASGLAPAVDAWLRLAPAVTDVVLVENRDDGRTAAGPGADLGRVARAAGLGSGTFPGSHVATDVGFTTWGKVKDLFR